MLGSAAKVYAALSQQSPPFSSPQEINTMLSLFGMKKVPPLFYIMGDTHKIWWVSSTSFGIPFHLPVPF